MLEEVVFGTFNLNQTSPPGGATDEHAPHEHCRSAANTAITDFGISEN
jgi:hypothetical protein